VHALYQAIQWPNCVGESSEKHPLYP
jgi:hypothetical protein